MSDPRASKQVSFVYSSLIQHKREFILNLSVIVVIVGIQSFKPKVE
jgi:hypothetical protein